MQSEQNSPDKSTNFSQQSDNQFEYRPEYDSDNPYQPPHSSFDEPEATFIGNYQKITFGDLIESNHSLSTKHVGSFIIIGLIFLLSLSPLIVVHVAREVISRNVQGHKVLNRGENNTPDAAGFVKSPLDLAFKFIELILDLFIGAFFAAGFAAYFLPLGKAGISRVGNFWNGMQYYGKVLTIIAIYHIPIQIVSAVGTFAIFMTFSSVQAIFAFIHVSDCDYDSRGDHLLEAVLGCLFHHRPEPKHPASVDKQYYMYTGQYAHVIRSDVLCSNCVRRSQLLYMFDRLHLLDTVLIRAVRNRIPKDDQPIHSASPNR